MLRISSPVDPTAQMFMRQTNTLSRQFWMLTDSSSLKKITTAQITLTYPCISASLSITVTIFANKTDQTYKSLLLTITFFSFRPFPLVRDGHSISSFSTSFCLQHSFPLHQLPPYLLLLHLKIFSLVSLFSSFPVTLFPSSFFLHTLGLSS